MRYGIRDQMFPLDHPNLPAEVAKTGAEGFEVQLGIDAEQIATRWSEARCEPFLAQVRAAGLAIASTCLGAGNRTGLGNADDVLRRAGVEALKVGFIASHRLGADKMLVPFFGVGELHDDDDIKRASESLRPFLAEAERTGVRIALETALPADRFAAWVDSLESEWVGVYHDFGNSGFRGRDGAEEMRLLRHRVFQVHFKDYIERINDCHLGQGQLDLEACRRAIDDVGYDGWVVLETHVKGQTIDDIRGDLEVVRCLLG